MRYKSELCHLWQKIEYEYKEEHMWSECPRNEYSRNKGKNSTKKEYLSYA